MVLALSNYLITTWFLLLLCCLNHYQCYSHPRNCIARLPIRGVTLIFTGGHISLTVAFKGPNVILGLYKCNYSLTRGKELGAAAG